MTLTVQFYTLISMIGMGSCFGAALDTYNRFLMRSKRRRWIVFIHDFLFWVLQGLVIFYVLFLVNEGEFRLYLFLALFCGFAAYQALFKGLYLKILEWLISFVVHLLQFISKSIKILVFHPIKWIAISLFSISFGLLKGLYLIIKWCAKLIFSILRILWKPFGWLFINIWKKTPEPITKYVEKFYNKIKGIIQRVQKSIKSLLLKWRKKKE
ncbi:spore cortex biosynthesis protein YabQ [Bacillus massiliglaciei]|uniref:spore cortex biosynthesis protein YabQ n=1 Tax=Bacillus massiliglaciei TaxID=1816693 RepID=UPI000A831127|nr:spore cortex biosynthesis protein YabQ [Bacillus massiliglaciei]